MTKNPTDHYLVTYWAGPKDGEKIFSKTVPSPLYYLTVKTDSEITGEEDELDYHHYVLNKRADGVYEYVYKGVVSK